MLDYQGVKIKFYIEDDGMEWEDTLDYGMDPSLLYNYGGNNLNGTGNSNRTGGLFKINEGEGSLLKNSKNTSLTYYPKGRPECFVDNIYWSTDSNKRYIQFKGVAGGETYEHASPSGFIKMGVRNDYTYKGWNWWSGGAAGYDGGNLDYPNKFVFDIWLDVLSPAELFGYSTELGTYRQDTVTLALIWSRNSDLTKGGSSWHLYLERDTSTHQVLLKMHINTNRFGDTISYFSAGESTKRLFSSLDMVYDTSSSVGGLHHLGVIVNQTNSPCLMIDGDRLDIGNWSPIRTENNFGNDAFLMVGSKPINSTGNPQGYDTSFIINCNYHETNNPEPTRFISHYYGKIYQFCFFDYILVHNTPDNILNQKAMTKIFNSQFSIPRKPEWVDFSDKFEVTGKNLLSEIGTIKQSIQGTSGQFYIQLNKIKVRNVD